MKHYSFDNKIDVNVNIARTLLELSEDEFYEYENFLNEFTLLVQSKNFEHLAFKEACDNLLNDKITLPRLYKKKYREFILKYRSFLKKNISSFDYRSVDKIYKLLKMTYKNKEAILSRMEKISEIGINHFSYVFEQCLSDSLVKCNSTNKIIDIATDGSVTYKGENGPYYFIDIQNAKYILEYSKEVKYDWAYSDWTMAVCNLMFDPSTLPTYEQLNNFDIKPVIDYKEAKKQENIRKQKEELISDVLYVDDTLEAIQDLKRRLEAIINSMGNNDILSLEELKKIQDIYNKLKDYKSHLIYQSTNNCLMNEEEIDKVIKTKKKSKIFK